ncbi:MAG: 50S ribosomal protein L10 [Bacteroidota bacterium]|nr:50S ribosomal protein L10 [Bacteroidota bacterium]MDP4226535.1 50S ribosomal protein L10 [Bacteroidota bacterium]MDP4272775.1 50S ribosomal protein L10 [Bacteroidota bacterium]
MKIEEKNKIIDHLTQEFANSKHFYLTDIETLNAADTSALRRKCFEKQIKLEMVKNNLLKKALEKSGDKYTELFGLLKNSTSVMFCDEASTPAKLIKEFRKNHEKPIIKGAYVEESIYVGDQLDVLASMKSKEELIGDIIALLQSPMKNVVSSLQSGKNIIAGVVKTLSERE